MFKKSSGITSSREGLKYPCPYDQKGELTNIEDCEECDISHKCDTYATMLDVIREE